MTGSAVRSGGDGGSLLLPWLLVGGVQLAVVLLWVRPGPLSIDEVHYLWMLRGLVEGHGLGLPNGYETHPSPELTLGFTYTTGGRITTQYPYGFPILALPFYAVFGILGLFVVNALAFLGVLVLTWKIGIRLLGDRVTALLGCAVLALGSFTWEYSVAVWPHMTALLAELGAFWFLLDALEAGGDGSRRWLRPAVAAGLLAGLATTIRLDAFFLLMALTLPFLVARPTRWRSLGGLALGFLPAALFLAVTNWLRWGDPWPLSYGRAADPGRILVLLVVGAPVLVLIWVASRPGVRGWVRRHAWTTAAAVAAVALLVLALPATRPFVLRAGEGFYALLVDLRGQEAGSGETARRQWALIYRDGLKKAFLQSCPWLPLVVLPFLPRRRGAGRPEADPGREAEAAPGGERRRILRLLALVPVVFVTVFSFFRWHGGMALNLRYFLPTLPFLALLAAVGIRRVAGMGSGAGPRRGTGWLVAGVLVALAGWAVLRPPLEPRAAALAVLDVPLFLALAVAALVLVVARSGLDRSRAAPALLLAAGLSAGWGGVLGVDYDARWSHRVRSQNLLLTLEVAEHLEEGDLVHLFVFDVWGAIKEFRPGAVLAFPRVDAYGDFRRLTFRVLDRGGRVYAALAPEDWEYLRSRGLLEGLEVRTVERQPFPLAELLREPPPADGSGRPPG